MEVLNHERDEVYYIINFDKRKANTVKFKEFTYQRPDLLELETKFSDLLFKFDLAECFVQQDVVMLAINELRSDFESMLGSV